LPSAQGWSVPKFVIVPPCAAPKPARRRSPPAQCDLAGCSTHVNVVQEAAVLAPSTATPESSRVNHLIPRGDRIVGATNCVPHARRCWAPAVHFAVGDDADSSDRYPETTSCGFTSAICWGTGRGRSPSQAARGLVVSVCPTEVRGSTSEPASTDAGVTARPAATDRAGDARQTADGTTPATRGRSERADSVVAYREDPAVGVADTGPATVEREGIE